VLYVVPCVNVALSGLTPGGIPLGNELGEDVKPILVKVGIGAVSLIIAELAWNVLILSLEYWGGSDLQQLVFWLSPLNFTGWLVFLILWALAYLGLSRLGAGLWA